MAQLDERLSDFSGINNSEHKEMSEEKIDTQSEDNENKSWSKSIFGPGGVLLGSMIGLTIGFILQKHATLSQGQRKWLEFPGELFIRALAALVVPLVFTTLSVSVSDVVVLGRAKGIGKLASLLFLLTSFIAAAEGVLWGLLFQTLFRSSEASENFEAMTLSQEVPVFAMQCVNGKYLNIRPTADGSPPKLLCDGETMSNGSQFQGEDIANAFSFLNYERDSYHALSEGTLTERTVQLLKNLIPDNIVSAFSEGTLISIVSFAIIFGITMAITTIHLQQTRILRQQQSNIDDEIGLDSDDEVFAKPSEILFTKADESSSCVLEVVRQINRILLVVVSYVMKTTPVAVLFLMMSMIGDDRDETLNMLSNTVFFVAVIILAHLFHIFATLPFLYYLVHHRSPYLHMRKMVPALIYGFGSASSIETLPVSIWCMDSTKQASQPLTRVVFQVGSTVNMDGLALYLPIAIIFILQTSGHADRITWWMIINIVLLSTIASIGAPPVPNAGLLMVLAVWQSVAGAILPVTFPYLVALEWLEDRFQTSTNIMSDAVVTLLIAPLVEETFQDELDRKEPESSSVNDR